jgi:hypothetical protein
MTMSRFFVLVLLTALTVHDAVAFNINQETSTPVYKDAIEKSVKKPLVSVSPLDDNNKEDCPVAFVKKATRERLAGPPDYWFHTNIHTFGNTGFFGALHAAVAPFFTNLIDIFAYEGDNVRVRVRLDRKQV